MEEIREERVSDSAGQNMDSIIREERVLDPYGQNMDSIIREERVLGSADQNMERRTRGGLIDGNIREEEMEIVKFKEEAVGHEIEEIEIIEEINVNMNMNMNEEVYVAVGKDPSVLQWALDNVVTAGGSVTLIHVYSQVKSIPTPFGRTPRNKLREEVVNAYVKEKDDKRRNFMQKYLQMCSDAQVKADTIVIESDEGHKSIVDLISFLHITKLILGMNFGTQSKTLRKLKMTTVQGKGKAEYVKMNAPDFCQVLVVGNRGKMSVQVDPKQKVDGAGDCDSRYSPFAIIPSPSSPSISRRAKLHFASCSCIAFYPKCITAFYPKCITFYPKCITFYPRCWS